MAPLALGVIVSDDMQDAMHNQARELLANGDAIRSRIPPRDVGGDVDVADYPATGCTRIQREGNDVRGTRVTEVSSVQRGDTPVVDEGDRESRFVHVLGAQHSARNVRHSLPAQRRSHSLRLHVDHRAHTEANSDVTPPLDVG
jgi:hypothetical protein